MQNEIRRLGLENNTLAVSMAAVEKTFHKRVSYNM